MLGRPHPPCSLGSCKISSLISGFLAAHIKSEIFIYIFNVLSNGLSLQHYEEHRERVSNFGENCHLHKIDSAKQGYRELLPAHHLVFDVFYHEVNIFGISVINFVCYLNPQIYESIPCPVKRFYKVRFILI